MELPRALLLLLLLLFDIEWQCLAGLKFQIDRHVTGLRIDDYSWNPPAEGLDWIRANKLAWRGPKSYLALSYALPAQPYWGQRVQLRAMVSTVRIDGDAFGALFVRVAGGDGRTLALDNMRFRRIVGWYFKASLISVVLDVPKPPPSDGDVCLLEEALPAYIHIGFMLSGGAGYIALEDVTFRIVGSDVPVTGGPAPWDGFGAI